MNRAERYFLYCYSQALTAPSNSQALSISSNHLSNGASAPVPIDSLTLEEWQQLLRLANVHNVFPMVLESIWRQSKKEQPALLTTGYKKAVDITLAQAKTTAEFLRLYQFLLERNLHPMVVKGLICRSLYPNSEQRASTDEDLFAPSDTFEIVQQALLDYGLRMADAHADPQKDFEISYTNGRVYIELHRYLFQPKSQPFGNLNRYFADVEKRRITEVICGVPVSTMGHTDHLFFLLCHAYKHFGNCGIGVRTISDIVLYSIAHLDTTDWNIITSRCRQLHIFYFVSALYRIGQKWLLPDTFPVRLQKIWHTEEADEQPLLADVLAGGVYGTSTEDRLHSANITLGVIGAASASSGKEPRKGAISPAVVIKTLFPPVRELKGRYPCLNRMPFLLPAVWIQRIFCYAAKNLPGRKKGNSAAEALRIGSERVELMKKYGLL